MIVLTIDGHRVEAEEGTSLLQASLNAGIYIPHLCAHEDLDPVGACGLCVVEIDGSEGHHASCMTKVAEGMVVTIHSEQLKRQRRLSVELMLSCHPADCTGCPVYGKCELQSLIQYLEVSDQRLRRRPNLVPTNTANPLVMHDMARCVLCGRCVRACDDFRGVGALTFIRKDGRLRVGVRDNLGLVEAGCRFCGSCIEVCPTGAIRDQDGMLDLTVSRKAAIVPCRTACPAGIDIPRYVRLVREGKPGEALAVIREKVPFPGVLGHICDHLCEGACRRSQLSESISIRALKRYAAEHGDDSWKANARKLPATGKEVAVVGSGPAGLTAAYYLAKQGHAVTVLEALAQAGGMMRVGIPGYRLPAAVLDGEIDEIRAAGVTIRTGCKVDSVDGLLADYDTVLVTVGAHQGIALPIGAPDLGGILLNTDFLRDAALGRPQAVGAKVVVLGGGNVAFDCAGVARRLGAKEVHIVCLEARESMRASAEEIIEALEAGTEIHASVSVREPMERDGRIAGVRCERIRSFQFGPDGQVLADAVPDSAFELEADTLIMAVGQRPDLSESFGLPLGRGNRIPVDEASLATAKLGVFAAGDVVYGTRSVIAAIAAGRAAAVSMDRYLGGTGLIEESLAPVSEAETELGRKEGFAAAARCAEPACGLNEAGALEESGRCLQCDLRLTIHEQKFWSSYPHH
jgi:NADPH-dependent glutamate synthase beta subunit-like oxidoreductase/ferredoxin